MKIANFSGPAVPIVGEPFKIMAHHPTVVIQCQCDAKAILCLTAVQVVSTCPACQNRYMIMDDMKVAVGAMRPAVEPSMVSQ